eukprot:3248224-Rhodomonas_salina.1
MSLLTSSPCPSEFDSSEFESQLAQLRSCLLLPRPLHCKHAVQHVATSLASLRTTHLHDMLDFAEYMPDGSAFWDHEFLERRS